MTMLLFFFFKGCADPRALPSFPTRRSSDLRLLFASSRPNRAPPRLRYSRDDAALGYAPGATRPPTSRSRRPSPYTRSEEHTSELQSRLHLVCRLLLEKKKTGE